MAVRRTGDTMSRPGTVSRGRPSRAATDAPPLRVVAERLHPSDAAADAVEPVPGPPPVATAPSVEPVPASALVPTPAVGLPVAVPSGALVLDPRAGSKRPGVLARLVTLVGGRRAGGRHRPDTVRGWSMFAPPAGARRRTPRVR